MGVIHKMKIRLAIHTDLEEISKCHKTSIQVLCRDDYSAEIVKKWTSILNPGIYESAIREKILIVAETEGLLLGFGILNTKANELSAIYVHPDSKGKGIGKSILLKLEAIALENHVNKLHLCSTINVSGFYKHHGYVEEGEGFHKLQDGTELNCIKMQKPLIKTV